MIHDLNFGIQIQIRTFQRLVFLAPVWLEKQDIFS